MTKLYHYGLLASLPLILSNADQAVRSDRYLAEWKVESPSVLQQVAAVNSGEPVVKARLLPSKLVILETEAVLTPSNVPTGTELIGVSAPLRTACTIAPYIRKNAFRVDEYLCFVDDNGDGAFDSTFRRGGYDLGIIQSFGKFPKSRKAIPPARFRDAHPSDVKNAPGIRLVFDGGTSFKICLDDYRGYPQACLTEQASVDSKSLPGAFELLGAKFTVHRKDAGTVHVSMDTPFPPEPFMVDE